MPTFNLIDYQVVMNKSALAGGKSLLKISHIFQQVDILVHMNRFGPVKINNETFPLRSAPNSCIFMPGHVVWPVDARFGHHRPD